MRIFYLFYFLFKFLHVAINEKIVDDCYYIDHLQDFFFTVNIAGITQNVSCANNCGCSGTNNGYLKLNCQSCCCQRRIVYKRIDHGSLNNVIPSAKFH